MDLILSRRSIRKFTGQKVSPELVEEILAAAMHAPSAGNQQPWHFVVINKRKLLDSVPNFHPYAKMIKLAPLAVLVCGDLSLEKFKGFWVQDCSAASQNILLAARAKGLGSVWLGIYPQEDRITALREMLGIPEPVVPFSLIPIGYPAEQPPEIKRYQPDRIHQNRW